MGRSQGLGTRLAPPLQLLAHSDVLNSTRRFAARVLLRIFVLMQHACIGGCAVSTRDLQNNTHARLVSVLFQHWQEEEATPNCVFVDYLAGGVVKCKIFVNSR